MSDTSQGPGWWEAADGKWYPPESHPDHVETPTSPEPAPGAPVADELGPPPGAPTKADPSDPSAGPAEPKGSPSRMIWIVLGAIAVVLIIVIAVMSGGGDDSTESSDTETEPTPTTPDEGGDGEPADEPNAEEQAVVEIADAVMEGFAEDGITLEPTQAACVATTVVSELGPEQALVVSGQMTADDTVLTETDARAVVSGYEGCLPMRDLILQGFAEEGVDAQQAECLTDRTMAQLEQVMVLSLTAQFEELSALTAGDREACGVG